MGIKKILTLSILSLLLFSCASTKKFGRISFGEGGGFTGAVTEYSIDSLGTLTKKEGFDGTAEKIGTVSKKDLKRFTQKAELLCKQDEFTQPGNLYYFIKIERADCKKSFTWGASGYTEPSSVKELYSDLKTLLTNKPAL